MDKAISYYLKDRQGYEALKELDDFSAPVLRKVRTFHRGFKEYSPTPLHRLKHLAKEMGVAEIFVKDESYRFGLHAFKVLGGSYAIGKVLAERLGMDIGDLSFDDFTQPLIKEKLGEITFVTATDGNHGKGIAWAARKLGQKSVVYMPRGSSALRLEAIKKEGAQASIIEGNYDDAVRLSGEMAREKGWVVVQDTTWPGYETIPHWIMQGYSTLIDEAMEQLEDWKYHRVSHVFLQAGVGSFAGGILAYLTARFGEQRPLCVVMEPREADCLFRSAQSEKIETVTGDMPTIMAGLACGEPNAQSYKIIEKYADAYLSCQDKVAIRGMRMLAAPLRGDPPVISGESGALGMGVLSYLAEKRAYQELREKLKLRADSVVLLISTEGDTDPKKYREIVWGAL